MHLSSAARLLFLPKQYSTTHNANILHKWESFERPQQTPNHHSLIELFAAGKQHCQQIFQSQYHNKKFFLCPIIWIKVDSSYIWYVWG
jgi:hypothetical protein